MSTISFSLFLIEVMKFDLAKFDKDSLKVYLDYGSKISNNVGDDA